MADYKELRVLSGTSHLKLTDSICEYLGISNGRLNIHKFANDNTFVQIEENIRERDVFIVQPFSNPVNDKIMETLIMIDAAKRASAGRITTVIPYFAYGRTDKKFQPRVPITARLIADMYIAAGVDRLVSIDLHTQQIQGFVDQPFDHLTAMPLFVNYFKQKSKTSFRII